METETEVMQPQAMEHLPASSVTETDKLILKFIWKNKGPE